MHILQLTLSVQIMSKEQGNMLRYEILLTRKSLSIPFREIVDEMRLVEARCRHLRDLVPRPALAEFPQRPLDGLPLHLRVDGLGEVVEHLRDEVLVAPEESCRVQRIAAKRGTDFLGDIHL